MKKEEEISEDGKVLLYADLGRLKFVRLVKDKIGKGVPFLESIGINDLSNEYSLEFNSKRVLNVRKSCVFRKLLFRGRGV